MAGFSYRVIHLAGSLNTNADVLSRVQIFDKPTEDDVAEFKQDLHLLRQVTEQHNTEDQWRSIPKEKIGKIINGKYSMDTHIK